jgi:hypothetical protein
VRGTLPRLLLAAVLVAVAVLLALAARDGWAWGNAIHDGDARASVRSVPAGSWTADEILPFHLARRALAVGDDVRFRRTLMLAIAAENRPVDEKTRRQRAPIEAALARIEKQDGDKARASRAANALGVLFFTDPGDPTAQAGEPTQPERALSEFRNAVTLDPGNVTAKRNLELLLQQIRTQSPQGSHKPGGGQKAGNRGAGVGPPGYGF